MPHPKFTNETARVLKQRLHEYQRRSPDDLIKDYPRAKSLFDRLIKKGVLAKEDDEISLLQEAKDTLTYYDTTAEGRKFLEYMFGPIVGKDSLKILGGIDNVATALAGTFYILHWIFLGCHFSTERGQQHNCTEKITMQGCSYDQKGSFEEKVGPQNLCCNKPLPWDIF